jgi:succinate dehydrogenase/fumarate reductase flavoprotein subunit
MRSRRTRCCSGGVPEPARTGDQEADTCDLLVIGAGAGGMSAALAGALMGLDVVLCEAGEQVGGTTATSAGTLWVPGNAQGAAAGFADSAAEAARYLDAILGADDPRGLRAAYLASAPEAIAFLETHSELRFASAGRHPDYLALPGAAVAGRALSPLPFDGRRLGRDFERIRAPMPEFMVLGGMMANKADVQALAYRWRSVANFRHAARLVLRHARDRLTHARGTRLVMGNALVARLYFSLRQAGVAVRFGMRLRQLDISAGRVTGGVFDLEGSTRHIASRLGVVLATGGVGHHATLRAQLAPTGVPPRTLRPQSFEGNRGEGLDAALRAGARLERHRGDFFWQPVSLAPRASGEPGLFPHLYLDRAKPGLIAVDADGRRFVDESASYHHFVEALLARMRPGASTPPAWLVCDAAFVRAYGLGTIPPGTRASALRRHEASGYLVLAHDIDTLATRLGIDARTLAATVARHNRHAEAGEDPDFGKGSTELGRFNGDAAHAPNPCLGPIAQAPFCALAVWPGEAASSAGLATDADGAVLDTDGQPIAGLYACGNDMASIMRGAYPGPGITLGPAIVFGWRIARHAARRNPHTPSSPR